MTDFRRHLKRSTLAGVLVAVWWLPGCQATGGPLAPASGPGLEAPAAARTQVTLAQHAAEAPQVSLLPEARAGLSVAGSYLAGRYAQRTNDWAAAADFMLHALAADPGNMELRRQTYLLLLGEGRYAEAVAEARALGQGANPDQLALTLLIAETVREGRTDEAARWLAAMPEQGLAQFMKPLLGAWLSRLRGEPVEDAYAALALLSRSPGFSALHDLHAGMIAELAGDAGKADEHFARIVESEPPLRVVQVVGGFYERTGRVAEARGLYQAFQQAYPDSLLAERALARLDAGGPAPAPVVRDAREGLAEALFNMASALHQEGATEMALLYGRLALHLRPDFPLARLIVGDVLAARGRHAEALAEYRAIAGDPSIEWTAQLRAADRLARLGRIDEAAALLDGMIAARPDRPDPLIELGDVLRSDGQFVEAIAAYDQALSRVDRIEPRHWSLYYARGMAFDRTQQWERAESDLLRALELNPDQPFLLNYLGYSWVDRGVNLERALKMIERAVELQPNDGYIIDSLGWAHYRLGNYTEAVTYLERAIELEPLDPVINDHLGDAYWQVGRTLEAHFQWRRALQYAEEPALVGSIRAKLEGAGPPRPRTADTAGPPTGIN